MNSGNERMESADAIAMYMENIPEESENNEIEKSRYINRKENIQQLPRSINGKCFINLPNLYKTDLNFSEEKYLEHFTESRDVM